MKLRSVAALLSLLAFLCFPISAFGADPETATKSPLSTEQRLEDLDFLYHTLKDAHPNLFANTPETTFLRKKAEIVAQIESMNDFAYALALQSLVALAGDSHTSASITSNDLHVYPFGIEYYNGQGVLNLAHKNNQKLLGQTVVALNDIPLEQVYERFRDFISYDNEIKLRRQFKQMVYLAEVLQYCGFAKPAEALTVTVANDQGQESKIVLQPLGIEEEEAVANEYVSLGELREKEPVTARNREKYYFAQPLDTTTYYIQYNQCREDENLPMADFCTQVQTDLAAANYTKIIVDLRYNGGGSDGVLVPLLTLLSKIERQGNIKLFCLVDEITFSSAINNAMMLKEMNAIVVGAPTSGSVDHYGSIDRFTLPHSGIHVSHSTKLIDIAEYLESGHGYGIETLVPDYAAAQTLSDYRAGLDTTVQYVLEHGDTLTQSVDNQAPLTRGGFLNLLQQKAQELGKGKESGACDLVDVFPFARNTPAVEWAYGLGLARGLNEAQFAPAHVITKEEIAVILVRFVDYIGQTPALRQADSYPSDYPQVRSWTAEAALTTWQWQGFAEGNSFEPQKTLTRQQGYELLNILFPL